MKYSLLFLALLMAGCAKKTPPPAADAPKTPPAKDDAAPKASTAVPEPVSKMIANFKRVHFEFNSFKLSDETRNALEENASIMKTGAGLKIEIQGHADERGTSEYNLSLGEKRAKAVKDYMGKLGVDGARVEIISYGEEKPLDEGTGEIAWSKNRRAEFRVTWGTDQAAGTTD